MFAWMYLSATELSSGTKHCGSASKPRILFGPRPVQKPDDSQGLQMHLLYSSISQLN